MANLAFVVSEFNAEITLEMEKKAVEIAQENNAQVAKIVHVPGAYDIPLVASALAMRDDIDAIVCLGAIIKGETKHDEIIAVAVAKSLAEISIEFSKPVTLGVIGPGATYEQAQARAHDYAKRAVVCAVVLLKALEEANDGAESGEEEDEEEENEGEEK